MTKTDRPSWPTGVSVGHTTTTSNGHNERLVLLNGLRLTPDEARLIADELLLRADWQDRTPDTCLVDGFRVTRRASH